MLQRTDMPPKKKPPVPPSLSMTPQRFREWRKKLGLKQKDAAELLGLKKRMIQYYEKGMREDKAVEIPKSVRLACYALEIGIGDFDGKKPANVDIHEFRTED